MTKTAAILLSVLALVLCGASLLRPRIPRSRLARDVAVGWARTAAAWRISRPGRYEMDAPCSHVAGATGRLTVEVTAGSAPGPDYVARDAEQAAAMALQGSREAVEVVLVLAPRPEGAPERPAASAGAGQARHAFTGRGGLHGFIAPQQADTLRLASALMPGDTVTVRGTLLTTASGRPGILVAELSMDRDDVPADEPPWTVTVWWGEQKAASVALPGKLPLRLPCLHREGAFERSGIAVREFRQTELRIGGNRVAAELADTPALRAWGLQGRPGLAADEGMLFCLAEPMHPMFVMRTVSFPISIAFIRADGTIATVALRAPGALHSVTSTEPVHYALEMPQGWFAERRIAPGSRVELP